MLLWKNTFNVKYLENDETYDDGVNGSRIGNHLWAIDWHRYLWPWMIWTVLELCHRILASNISNTVRDTNVGHNGSQMGNHLLTCDWHYEFWPPMTFNCPRSRSVKFHIKYFENCDRYDDGVNGSWIGNHPWTIDWHRDLWPWMTLNRPRSRSQDFSIEYLEYGERHNVWHNAGQTGNHIWTWTYAWHYEHWPWMTFSCPSSRSIKLLTPHYIVSRIMPYVATYCLLLCYGMEWKQHWAYTRSMKRISCLWNDRRIYWF